MREYARVFAAIALGIVASECGGGGGGDKTTAPTTPVVASVAVAPTPDTVAIGKTVQLSATASDSRGAVINGQSVTWSSSASGVASVTSGGVVSGVAAGSATISATVAGVSGSASVTVIIPAFAPATATTLSGTQTFATVNIPAGVTVTATADLELNVTGATTIAGNLLGNCVRIHVNSGGALNVTGKISNVCGTPTAQPPELRLVGGSYALAGDTIASAGALTITNDTTMIASSLVPGVANDVTSPQRPGTRRSLPATGGAVGARAGTVFPQQQAPAGCSVAGKSVYAGTAANGVDGPIGTDGAFGNNVLLLCNGDLVVTVGFVFAGSGGRGGAGIDVGSNPAASALGGTGGDGGRIIVNAKGNILFGASTLLAPGAGGKGGDATAKTDALGGSATAIGGNGGSTYGVDGVSGPISVVAGLKITSLAPVYFEVDFPGDGGTATAQTFLGADAGSSAARPGGNATARGGAGGSVRGRWRLTAKDLTGMSVSDINAKGTPAFGGWALAWSGAGGGGNLQFPTGASGGDAFAQGGQGGAATLKDHLGQPLVFNGGDGGAVTLRGGSGGPGYVGCQPAAPQARGGNGGNGGVGTGTGGLGGVGNAGFGVNAALTISNFGNGGAGGDGNGAGFGGAGGTDLTTGLKSVSASFQQGTAGKLCPGANLTIAAYPDLVSLNLNEKTTVGITATNPDGSSAPTPAVTFSSSNNAVATVDAAGSITAKSAGTATITVTPAGGAASMGNAARRGRVARSSGGAALSSVIAPISVPVTVYAITVPSIVIAPNPATVAVGGHAQLAATVNGAAPAYQVGWFATDLGTATTVTTAGVVTGVAPGATVVRGSVSVTSGSGLVLYNRATVVNVTAPAQACAATGVYSFARTVEYDDAGSQDLFMHIQDPLPLTFTITGTSFTVSGPAPFIGGTGTIDSGCNLRMTATGTVLGIPNVNAILSGALPATGTMRLVYQMGGNGSLPRGFPVYYRLTK